MDEFDIVIQHVTFRPDNRIEITYCEKFDITDKVAIVKTIIVDSSLLEQNEYVETLKSLASFVDEGLLRLRNPDASIA